MKRGLKTVSLLIVTALTLWGFQAIRSWQINSNDKQGTGAKLQTTAGGAEAPVARQVALYNSSGSLTGVGIATSAIDVTITGEYASDPLDTALRVLMGSVATPLASRKPGVYWQRVDNANHSSGDRYYSIFGAKTGGSGGVENFAVESRSMAVGSGLIPGMVGISSRMISENSGNSDFAIWGTVQCFTSGSHCTGAELNVTNNTVTDAGAEYGIGGNWLTGLVLASTGTAKSTVANVIDSQNGQTSAWQRGIDIRPNGVVAGGYGLLLPNNVRIGGRTVANQAFPLLWTAESQTRLNTQAPNGIVGCVDGANCVPLRSGLRYSLVASSSPIANTAAETTFDKVYTIPAGEINVTGAVVRVRLSGTYSTQGTPSLTLGLRLGAQTCAGEFLSVAPDVTSYKWVLEAECVVRQTGTSGIWQRGYSMLATQGGSTAPGALSNTFTLNTQTAVEVRGVVAWSVAAPGNSVVLDSMTVWIEYPQTTGS